MERKNTIFVMGTVIGAVMIGSVIFARGLHNKSKVSVSLEEDTVSDAVIDVKAIPKESQEEAAEQWKKGYDLLVDEQEEKEAENDCRAMMERIYVIYKEADKGTASNVVLSDAIALAMETRCC